MVEMKVDGLVVWKVEQRAVSTVVSMAAWLVARLVSLLAGL
jgi:hypothetical protein